MLRPKSLTTMTNTPTNDTAICPKTGALERVRKVASRWSDTGCPESSILDIFRRHNVVFVGRFQNRFCQISVGDLIAISDYHFAPANHPPVCTKKLPTLFDVTF